MAKKTKEYFTPTQTATLSPKASRKLAKAIIESEEKSDRFKVKPFDGSSDLYAKSSEGSIKEATFSRPMTLDELKMEVLKIQLRDQKDNG